jgi:hypothetical protein
MKNIDKARIVKDFVSKRGGFPIVWTCAIAPIEILEKAYKLIAENPKLTLEEFKLLTEIDCE